MSEVRDFWSRRRAGVAAEAEAEKAALDARHLAAEQAALEEKPDEEILAELGLPDPDTLGPGDDFSAFMAKAVPDRIRRLALRKLWRTNPVLANVDMLVDYGEDFTDSAVVIENLQTTYQVGKGMLRHVQEMARQAEEKERLADAEPEQDPEFTEGDAEALSLLEEAETEAGAPVAVDHAALPEFGDEVEPVADLQPRRMKFRFEETA